MFYESVISIDFSINYFINELHNEFNRIFVSLKLVRNNRIVLGKSYRQLVDPIGIYSRIFWSKTEPGNISSNYSNVVRRNNTASVA